MTVSCRLQHLQEKTTNTVNVRTRDNAVHGKYKISDLMSVLKEERDTRALESIFSHKKDLAQQEDGSSAADGATGNGEEIERGAGEGI